MGKIKKARDLVGMALTRALTLEQLNGERNGQPLHRQARVRNVNEEARTVEVAFSSETPVSRWFGDEVLDHSQGAMIADRLSDGAAVLWNHNSDVQIGVVESAVIGSDRVGRAVLRFGSGQRASEIFADIVAGIIRHVSVGYWVRAFTEEVREGETELVTITSWEPFEISMVAVPADASVGVGRSAGNPPEDDAARGSDTADHETEATTEGPGTMNIRILRNAAGDLVRAEVDENGKITKELEVLERAAETAQVGTRAAEAERTRVSEILAIGEQHSVQRLATAAISDGVSVDTFTRTVLDQLGNGGGQGSDGSSRAADDDAGVIGMTASETQRYSFIRAMRALLNPSDRRAQEAAAFEFEASRAAEQSMGRTAQGLMVPVDVLTRALNTGTSGTNPGDTGGFFVDTTLMTSSFIELLRNRSVFLSLATPMGGLIGNVDIPGQASSGNTFWVGEEDDVGEGSMDGRTVPLSPRTIGVFGDVTRRMMQQSSLDVEAAFRASLARDLALGIDLSGFYGAGSANVPLGIENYNGVNAVLFDAVQPTYQELIEMETAVSTDNADVSSMAYIANAKFRGHAKSTEKFAGSSGQTIWETGGTVNGYRTEITNQIADGDVFFGNFADINVGMWGGLDILVDPYTKGRSGAHRIIMHQDVDIAPRHVESLCVGRDNVA